MFWSHQRSRVAERRLSVRTLADVAWRRRVIEPDTPLELDDELPSGKGRPTPKRSEARRARRTASAPRTRKEAAAQLREKNRVERRKQRSALVTGDERNLPPRDAGPAKRLARDLVDSRFTSGQVFFGFMLVTLILSLTPNHALAVAVQPIALLCLIALVVDGARHARRAKRVVMERYGASAGTGITSYAFMRALQPRRLRRPPPKVERGTSV